MYLDNLILQNYRSYENLSVRFEDGINILQGKNAAGKTNVLEAIGFLSFGKSFRTGKDSECIQEKKENAYIKGDIVRTSGQLSLQAFFTRQGTKSLKVNSEPVKRMGELFGNFIAIVFSPEDIKVLKESPSLRRRFIDMEISKMKRIYFFDLLEYQKALAQKNALLKSRMKETQLKKLVTVFNEQLSEYGEKIITARRIFLERIGEQSRDIHKDLANGEELSLKYRCSVSGDNIRQALFDKMEKSLSSEIEQGFCLHGPHREDVSVFIGGNEVKAYSSQGQIRTTMLSLKLATLEIAKKDFEESPVLLLDDVFSELDEIRQRALLERIKGVQCFITTATAFKSVTGKVYTVKHGTVKE